MADAQQIVNRLLDRLLQGPAIYREMIGQLRPRVFRQVDQHAARPGSAGAFQVKAVIAHHHQLARCNLPGASEMQQATRIRLGRRLVTANHVRHGKAVVQTDGAQGQQRQFMGVAGENAKPATTPAQLAHQLNRPGGWLRSQSQFTLMLQQPGMLGRRLRRRSRSGPDADCAARPEKVDG